MELNQKVKKRKNTIVPLRTMDMEWRSPESGFY
jgi:hypothetical protein